MNMEKNASSKPLHICLVTRYFSTRTRQASRSILSLLIEHLTQKGHHITVLAYGGDGDCLHERLANADIYYLRPTYPRLNFAEALVKQFTLLSEKTHFEVVHAFDRAAYSLLSLKEHFQFVVILDIECTQISQLYNLSSGSDDNAWNVFSTGIAIAQKFLKTYLQYDRHLLDLADSVVVPTEHTQLLLERFYLYPFLKTKVIPYGVEPLLTGQSDKAELRKTLNLPESAKIVLTQNPMNDFLTLRQLFQAFQRVAIKRPSVRLIVIGHGPYFKQLEYEMLSLALGDKVTLAGAVDADTREQYIEACDLYISNSSSQIGFDSGTLEAMAQGKATLVTLNHPMAPLIKDGIEAFMLHLHDIEDTSQLIQQLISDEDLAREVGVAGKNLVRRIFKSEKVAELTLSAYLEALHKARFSLKKGRIAQNPEVL